MRRAARSPERIGLDTPAMARLRIGVVLLVHEPVATEVTGLRRAVGDPNLGRIPAHITLVPPVNVREEGWPDVLDGLRQAAHQAVPFQAVLGPAATFLPVNPVLYLQVSDGGEVADLRARARRPPLDRPDPYDFVPHVTLTDNAPPERIEAARQAMGEYRSVVWFDRLHVLRQREDQTWEPLADAAFDAPRIIGRGGLPLEVEVTRYGVVPGREPFAVTARRDGVVVGVANGSIEGDDVELTGWWVAVPNEGIGTHLLNAVEQLGTTIEAT